MKINKIGVALSVGMLALLLLVNLLFYSFAMNTILVTSLIVLSYALFVHYKKSKSLLPYAAYLVILVGAIAVTLPAMTTGMAERKVEDMYDVDVEKLIVERADVNSFNPISSNHVYTIEAVNDTGGKELFQVNPTDGAIKRID